MASSNINDWQMVGYPGIFEKIILMVTRGSIKDLNICDFHESLKDLDNCRLVCKTWNDMIMNKILKNPTKKWGTIIQRRIEKSWDEWVYYPTHEEISRAKLFGKHRVT